MAAMEATLQNMAVGLPLIFNCPPSAATRVRPVSTPHSILIVREIQAWRKTLGSQDASLCAVGVGCIDWTNKISRRPVQFGLQMNDRYIFSITKFRAIVGPTHTNHFSSLIWNSNWTGRPVLCLEPCAWAPAHLSPWFSGHTALRKSDRTPHLLDPTGAYCLILKKT